MFNMIGKKKTDVYLIKNKDKGGGMEKGGRGEEEERSSYEIQKVTNFGTPAS